MDVVFDVTDLPPAPRRPMQRPGPAGGKRDRNRRERTRALLESALALFLARGLEAVPIDEIASRAGMAKGNFYRYFPNKEALVETLMAPLATAVREALQRTEEELRQTTTQEEMLAVYERLASWVVPTLLRQLGPLQLYLQERRGPASGARVAIRQLADELYERSVRLTEVARAHGLIEVGDPRISALAVVGACEELALGALQGRLDPVDPDEVSRTLIRLVVQGLRAGQRS